MKRASSTRVILVVLLLIAVLGPAGLAQQQQDTVASQNAQSAANSTAKPERAKPVAGVAPVAGTSAATPVEQQASKSADQKGAASKENVPDERQKETKPNPPPGPWSTGALVIVGLMIAVLGLLFLLQMWFSHRLEQTTYLGGVYRDSVFTYELNRLSLPHNEDWNKGIYIQRVVRQNPIPTYDSDLRELDYQFGDGYLSYTWSSLANQASQLDLWDQATLPPGLPGLTRGGRSRFVGSSTGNLVGVSADHSHADNASKSADQRAQEAERQHTAMENYQQRANALRKNLDEWKQAVTKAARLEYDADLAEARQTASKNAEQAVSSTEVSVLRGQGPQFVLEFTALIVIIFLAVVLGVLGVLGEQQIGTLLAAIAGYVLGKASTSGGSTGEAKAPMISGGGRPSAKQA